MSAFGIFALILTTAYIIYFAVTISRDIVAGRKKAEDSPESETFEVSSSAPEESDTTYQEESVAVYETEYGFTVGTSETKTEKMLARDADSNTTTSDEDTAKDQNLEESIEDITSGTEDISGQVDYQETYDDVQFDQYLQKHSNGHSHLFKKIDTAAEESIESEADDGLDEHSEEEVITTDQPEERDWM